MKRDTRSVRPLVYFALFSLLVISIFGAMPANADELYASIRGTVTDQSGALVPDARITVTNVATGLSKTVRAKDGEFAILQLPVGDYSLRIEKSGFRTYTASGIHLIRR
jgi:carboxypeptidase family protein